MKLGEIIKTKQTKSDAKITKEPGVAAEVLEPGQKIGLTVDGKCTGACEKFIGVVDPFLKRHVMTGEMFWVLLYPTEELDLYEVPKIPEITGVTYSAADVRLARYNLHRFAYRLCINYISLKAYARNWERRSLPHRLEPAITLPTPMEIEHFWSNYTVLTGRKVPDAKKVNFFIH
jgi:hypothetical protein